MEKLSNQSPLCSDAGHGKGCRKCQVMGGVGGVHMLDDSQNVLQAGGWREKDRGLNCHASQPRHRLGKPELGTSLSGNKQTKSTGASQPRAG